MNTLILPVAHVVYTPDNPTPSIALVTTAVVVGIIVVFAALLCLICAHRFFRLRKIIEALTSVVNRIVFHAFSPSSSTALE